LIFYSPQISPQMNANKRKCDCGNAIQAWRMKLDVLTAARSASSS
jgi:hypothetical protein